MRNFKAPFFDSEFTDRGTIRKRIYTKNGETHKHEAKLQALKDFREEKKKNKTYPIDDFNRRLGVMVYDHQERYTIMLHQEWADAALQYMRYIL